MKAYAAATGMALARAHARSGDAAMLSGYMGTGKSFDEALADLRRALRRPERARPRDAR